MKRYVLIATLGSAALLLGALGFQYLGGLPPCKMCIWQRWPHLAAIVIGLVAWKSESRNLAYLGAVAVLITAGIGFYHAGVEQMWWEGPNTCTSGGIEGLTTEQLMEQIMGAPLVRCDEIQWSLFGLSMAAWNAVISFALAGIWLMGARRK